MTLWQRFGHIRAKEGFKFLPFSDQSKPYFNLWLHDDGAKETIIMPESNVARFSGPARMAIRYRIADSWTWATTQENMVQAGSGGRKAM
jgi:hypothetical protein